MRWQDDLTRDQEKRYTLKHRLSDLANVLHRPVEIAAKSRHGNESIHSRRSKLIAGPLGGLPDDRVRIVAADDG